MPRICEFYGIIVSMYRSDHAPPHFHVRYGEYKAVYTIAPVGIIKGRLPKRAHGLIVEWAGRRQADLKGNWARAQRHDDPQRIPPLD